MNKPNVPPPPRAKAGVSRLPSPAPASAEAPNNLATPTEDIVFLSFKVSPKFRRQFKRTANEWGMTSRELMEASFRHWLEKHGEAPPEND